ncbi:copper resistance protein CopC [Herbidospora galbida]|uniref:Copper resistance protein CopC n=1 Tax=Herbidospora galbida TaxID=2575442 RepID=A0A4U3LRX7_9ACTN|nr:copper resistance CopC family protein [Herbidospora galbida]TKK77207.1 copper resistance protein CopC [Herbidospora galbida]
MRFLALLAAMVATLVAGSATALAHDQLKASDPAKNATVESLDEITLTFSAGVRFPAMVLHDAAGTAVELTRPETEGKLLTARPLSAPPPGKYVIGWRVVSSDGHPIEGEIPFTLAGAAAETAATPASTPVTRPVSASEDDSGGGGRLWIVGGVIALLGLGFFVAMGRRKTG